MHGGKYVASWFVRCRVRTHVAASNAVHVSTRSGPSSSSPPAAPEHTLVALPSRLRPFKKGREATLGIGPCQLSVVLPDPEA